MSNAIEQIDLTLDPFATTGALIEFICDQFEQRGFEDAVIGLSGGVDSALGLALVANALGPKHVTALAMPADQSSPQSLADARLVARTFGAKLKMAPIGPIVKAVFGGRGTSNKVRIGNAAARARMIRLFDYSQEHGALVVGTSNKTEMFLGYGTWYGDLACSLNPLGDLYKTQVWQLAEFIGVPDEVLEKPPSADLWSGQTDEGEMGLTYEDVDRMLYLMVDCDYSFEALHQVGFSRAFMRKVCSRIVSSEFKRALPTIPSLSSKPVAANFELPPDCEE